MNSASQKLNEIIEVETPRIEKSFDGDASFAISSLIRSLDVFYAFYPSDKKEEIKHLFEYGWSIAIKPFMTKLNVAEKQPFLPSFSESIDWANSNIMFAGKIGFFKQILEYEKANVITITQSTEKSFTFQFIHTENGVERFDKISTDFVKDEIIEKIIKDRQANFNDDKENILTEFRKYISNPYGEFISYNTTPTIDEFYDRQGHYQILRMQGYDDFHTKDIFGGIEYWKYVDLVEKIIGIAIKHTDACYELYKMNPNVLLPNLISYMSFKDGTIRDFANYLGVEFEEIEQIFSCLTLSKDNYEYYLDIPCPAPPMFIQLSDEQILRSIAGCLSNPLELLNREIKRKFKRDYDLATTKREERFRKELFDFFPEAQIVKIPKGININISGRKTDIDAILFDKRSKTLGLFQLKWQDPFFHSMRERYSKISNLYPKAVEWIDKVEDWLKSNDNHTILNALKVNEGGKSESEINEVYIFIVGRNNLHFTGVIKDERAVWGSWNQIIEATARIKMQFNNPIKEMFLKLKFFDPSKRLKTESLDELEDFEMYLGDYKIYYKNK